MTPPSRRRKATSNRQRIATALQRAISCSYQQALQRVEQAASRGLLPPVLDAAGRKTAVQLLSSNDPLPSTTSTRASRQAYSRFDAGSERDRGLPQGVTPIPDGRGNVYLRPLTEEEKAALPRRPYNKLTLEYVPDPVRYRPVLMAQGRYEPLATPFYDLPDAQRRCEHELLSRQPDARFHWEPVDEPPTTSWQIATATPPTRTPEDPQYWVVIVGSDFDDGPQKW